MFAIAFDLTVAEAELHHPNGYQRAYADIGAILAEHGFERVQGSLYVSDNENIANLVNAIDHLRALDWFRNSIRDIRGSFRCRLLQVPAPSGAGPLGASHRSDRH